MVRWYLYVLMHLQQLHHWDVTPEEAIRIQKDLRDRIREEPMDPKKAVLIAGVDVSSSKDSDLLTAGIIVWDRLTNEIQERVAAQAPSPFPYIPGLLSFREIPVLSEAIKQLTVEPDLFMIDGQGIAHPRRLGIASHLGLLLDRPTIGVAKSRLCGRGDDPDDQIGSTSPLIDHGEQIGVMLRSKMRSKPLYISIGHRMRLEDAIEITRMCLRGYRLPEPTRLTHLYVNEVSRASISPISKTLL